MADIIDLALVQDTRRLLHKLLSTRGLAYFLQREGNRLFHLEPRKVELVLRVALRSRPAGSPRPPEAAIDYCRREVRRELIRRVVEAMLQTGL